ncbi:hypothetical protein MTP99_006945 [Tenebrio molitor]|nr:hypothetical protein MTP99_006945 [Tenebrio molitor]
MHYLTSSLRGNAARLIGNLSVCGDSFKTAWDLLTKRYENKRLLITAQLYKLFSPKRIENRSAKELNDLLNRTSEAVNALRALDSPVDQWDQLLVHLLVQKLDIRTREDWEFSLGTILTSRRTSNLHNNFQPVQGHRKASRVTEPHENHHGSPLKAHQPSRLNKRENVRTTVHAAQNLTSSCSVLSSDSMTQKNFLIG